MKPGLRRSRAIRLAKPPSATARTPTRCSSTLRGSRTGAEPFSEPGSIESCADTTSSGLWRRFLGYARSSELIDFEGTLDEVTCAPDDARTVISFQPIRPA